MSKPCLGLLRTPKTIICQSAGATLYMYCHYNFENDLELPTIGKAIKFTEDELLKSDGKY